MPRWVLYCPICEKEFTHSNIERRNPEDYYIDPKPEFPAEGLSVECPNCKKSSVYRRHQLVYRAD
jgi:endogenous inhibitor of DNA gyrase (YacG/DUF329 family)